ncbi:uncharacterized protein G2W53_026210 [Senna tora]|uniref:Uncharacterized protein n=1 Tax=Senna tora TaxID=362788 RepID=A0A834TFB1_9FABA|nr:uncharacterized protein G2W53_026210 [Senna tora]
MGIYQIHKLRRYTSREILGNVIQSTYQLFVLVLSPLSCTLDFFLQVIGVLICSLKL